MRSAVKLVGTCAWSNWTTFVTLLLYNLCNLDQNIFLYYSTYHSWQRFVLFWQRFLFRRAS
jgi:hypothetical protein